jgi:hypothetical protein
VNFIFAHFVLTCQAGQQIISKTQTHLITFQQIQRNKGGKLSFRKKCYFVMNGSVKRKTREDGKKNILCSEIIVDRTK